MVAQKSWKIKLETHFLCGNYLLFHCLFCCNLTVECCNICCAGSASAFFTIFLCNFAANIAFPIPFSNYFVQPNSLFFLISFQWKQSMRITPLTLQGNFDFISFHWKQNMKITRLPLQGNYKQTLISFHFNGN